MIGDPLISAIAVSLEVSLCATILCSLLGIPLGLWIAGSHFRGKQLLVTLLNSLLAFPTVVVGLLVYSIIRRGALLGDWQLLFTPAAIVLGQTFLAFPIVVTLSLSAATSVDRAAVETARLLGAGAFTSLRVLLQECRFGILAAVAATFGRLIGEVGISMILGGNIFGYTRTMTTSIALEISKGEFALALRLGSVLLTLALAVNVLLRFLQGKGET